MVAKDDTRTFAMLAKPVSGACNLSCEYCYYAGKQNALHVGTACMSDKTLKVFIRQSLAMHGRKARVEFAWHGGEPILAGQAFFENMEEDLGALMEANRGFGMHKAYGLPEECLDCSEVRLCFGGCPKDRLRNGKNYLCEGYRAFSTMSALLSKIRRKPSHAHPELFSSCMGKACLAMLPQERDELHFTMLK